MPLVTDITTMFILIVASTAIYKFYSRESRDRTAVGFLALALATFNIVYAIRVSGIRLSTADAETTESVLFLITAVFACIFVIIHFLKDKSEERYGDVK